MDQRVGVVTIVESDRFAGSHRRVISAGLQSFGLRDGLEGNDVLDAPSNGRAGQKSHKAGVTEGMHGCG